MTNCPPRGLLDGFEEFRGPERAAVREHVRGCGSCRAAWLAADPSRLFAFLALQPVPPQALESVSADVSSAVRETIPENSWAGARVFRPLAWAAAVLVAVLLGSPEPVFGWVKHVLGFRQFSLRGLQAVTGEWDLVCLAQNLKRMQGLGWVPA